jgi:DNA-binding response OmpR family regulator
MRTSREKIGHLSTSVVVALADHDLRSLYASTLRRAGHVVREAADGGEALRLLRAHSPDLILLDLWMPVMNGLEVLGYLRGNTPVAGVKVAMLSQKDDADTHLEGFALGIDDYWTKDLSLDELRDRVDELVRPAEDPAWRRE